MALTKQYVISIDGKDAIATVGQLKTEVQRLEEELDKLPTGSKEAEAAILALGKAKGAVKQLDDAVDALDPKMKAAAFVDAFNGIVGVVSAATAAFTLFGIESDTAKEVEQKLLGLMAVMQGVESVSRALNSETLSVIKSTMASAKAYFAAGEAASTGSKATKAALISTGIGALVVALGVALALVVENWDKLTASVKGSETFLTKTKAVLSGFWDAFLEGAKVAGTVLVEFFTGDYAGAVVAARSFGQRVGTAYAKGYAESIFESSKAGIRLQIEALDRQAKAEEAAGRDAYALKKKSLQLQLKIQGDANKEEKKQKLDLANELRILDIEQEKKLREQKQAAQLARLNAAASIEEAKGNDAARLKLKALRQQLQYEEAAEQQNAAKIIELRAQIRLQEISTSKKAAAEKRADLIAAQQQELALLEQHGKYTLDTKVRQARDLLTLDTDTSQAGLKQREADQRALDLLEDQQRQAEVNFEADKLEELQKLRDLDLESQKQLFAGTLAGAKEADGKLKALAKEPFSLGSTILAKVFGVKPEQMEAVKAAIAEAVGIINQALSSATESLLSASMEAVEAKLQATQGRLQEIDQRLQASSSQAEQTAAKIEAARGAQRDYLIQKLVAERAEEQRLRAEKAAAAAEEQKQLKEKHRLEVISARLSAASTLATNLSTAASAVSAAVNVINGSSTLPPPANIIAIVAGLAAVTAALASAKQLGNTFKKADGGIVDGPPHSQGGVRGTGRFNNIEVEGGEMVIPTDATANNFTLLELIRTRGRRRALSVADLLGPGYDYQIAPPPGPVIGGRYADGGRLPTSGVAADVSTYQLAALTAEQARTNELLLRLAEVSAVTARNTATVAAYGPPVLEFGYAAEAKRQQLQEDMFKAKDDAMLGGLETEGRKLQRQIDELRRMAQGRTNKPSIVNGVRLYNRPGTSS